MKFVLGAAAAFLLAGAAFVQPAEAARCITNGVAMGCFHHPHFWGHRHFDRDFDRRPFHREWRDWR